MAPIFGRARGRSSGRFAGRSRGARGRGSARTSKGANFSASRLQEAGENSEDSSDTTDQNDIQSSIVAGQGSDEEQESSDDEDVLIENPYTSLLQSLMNSEEPKLPPRKKRKVLEGQLAPQKGKVKPEAELSTASGFTETKASQATKTSPEINNEHPNTQPDDELELESDGDASEPEQEDLEEEEDISDPFEVHFANVSGDALSSHVALTQDKRWKTMTSTLYDTVRVTRSYSATAVVKPETLPAVRIQHVKVRLSASANRCWERLGSVEKGLATTILQYTDTICGLRSMQNSAQLRDIACLHAVNHVFKTRDRVIKNQARLSQQNDSDALDLRDQGFTRPKVLFLLPTRQSCVRFLQSIVSICEPDQQENKARFMETFNGPGDDEKWAEKPEDFRDLFGGNDDDMFRLGLKFTRKTIKYFSAFYSSDMILASPLGLRNAIENGGGGNRKDGEEKKKGHDADFLSSIEIVIMDHANALQMQNWQHVEYIFSQLNLLPKDAHGCDFSRVRTWYLDKHAKYLRQTIILSDFITPEINSLASVHMHNISGKAKFVPTYKGAMLDLPASIPTRTTQTFYRFDSPSPATDPDSRFKHFCSTVLPPLLRDNKQQGVLVFVPSSFDFIRLRNYLATAPEAAALTFGAVSEYASVREAMRARSHFLAARHRLLLYSERAHHFRRYRLRGVRQLVFYGVPENSLFWPELVGFLGLESPVAAGDAGAGEARAPAKGIGAVKALFSKWDVLKLERIVGTERVGRLVTEKGGDTFEFV